MGELISHRGNITKPIPERENKPSYIDSAIQLGLKVEVDIRYIDEKLWLGHDLPETQINHQWLQERSKHLWLHCKNVNAAIYLAKFEKQFQYFCHSCDPYVLTSTGVIWAHDISLASKNTIIPLIDSKSLMDYKGPPAAAYCTDFISSAKQILTEKGIL